MVSKPILVWNKMAEASLMRIYQRIQQDSPQNADKVRDEIFSEVSKLATHPERHPPDKFKFQNPSNYRAFELYSCRVAYKHTENEIRILRVRHVKQEPKFY